MKKHLITLLKIMVTLGLSLWLIFSLDWREVFSHLSGMKLWPILLYILFQLIGNFVSVVKWRVIAGHKGLSFYLKDGFFTYMTGAFINNFLPSTIGGDTYRALWLGKRSSRMAAAASTVVFDRLIGFWTLALLAMIFSYFLIPYIPTHLPGDFSFRTLSYAIFSFIGIYVFFTVLYWQPWFLRLANFIPSQKIQKLFREFAAYNQFALWIKTALWSAVFMFIGIGLCNHLLFSALGVEVPLLPYLGSIFIIAIFVNLPISISNIGVKEWAYAFFFTLIGIDFEVAVVAALLSRFIQTFISFIALPHYLSSREKEKSLPTEASEPKEILS